MTSGELPAVQTWFQDGFHRFLRPFLRRHFHTVAVDRRCLSGFAVGSEQPLLIYGNHPSWWDPLIAHFLNRALFPSRQFYAPIDAAALQRYGVFEKLGFYGVQLDNSAGASVFLKRTLGILKAGNTAVWITPEGRFADARNHSAPLMPGLAHLCTRISGGFVIPLALEYVFWDERLPKCLAKFGTPIDVAQFAELSKSLWSEMLRERLRDNQRHLAEASIARSSEPFENLLRGKRGAGGMYDAMRRLKTWASGKEFRAAHGDQFE